MYLNGIGPAISAVGRLLVWGVFCHGGAPRVLSIFLYLSFLVDLEQAVSSFRP
jgi:hypothetical protein